ncbi:hypothetical protein [Chitinophaga eiseniae]|uniref:hypothetical protein n=1 Tax=Chitinophaga eiseniae TaxID=634771 RepID=UPI0013566DC9|nr:hypothetical protein [Chitinophaga eiseniae]
MTKAEAFRQLVEAQQQQPVYVKIHLMEVLLFEFTLAGRCGILRRDDADFIMSSNPLK